MAIEIKSIPVLKGKEAEIFVKKANKNLADKHTIDVTKKANIVTKILAKAKI